jgi:hypothetical protein
MRGVEPEPSPAADQKPGKLRWCQYRLRSLFVLTTLVAIACSWLAVMRQEQRKQGAAAEAIRRAVGTVRSEPTWLGKLLRDDSLVTVIEVDLFWQSTTDNVLVHLQGLKQLQVLWLARTHVTDAGLVHLQGLKQLQSLWLDNTHVTDAGLVHLQGLKQLRVLGLDSTHVTDAGLAHLQGLTQLQWLGLRNKQVTDTGVKKLQQALPNCQIQR